LNTQPLIDTEHVLLCKRERVQEIMGKNVLIPISRGLVTRLADPSAFWFGPRHLIETDMKYVQLVSYVIIEHDSRILCYQRGNDSSEQRLKNKLSIGLGGHISLQDARTTNGILDVEKTIKAGATREVREELEVHKVTASKRLVLLHSRLNTVDEVHCGFVEVWKVESPQVATREKSLKTIGFKSLSELAVMQGFESWSTLLIQYLNNTSQSIQ
jgi:predicted NUDIX family phosphoesterase